MVDGFHIDVVTPKVKIRNEKGHYHKVSKLFAAAKEQATIQQGLVLQHMRTSMERPSVSTGRLVAVTAASENVVAERTSEDQFTVGLGNVDYLDHSIAKYWRTIEEGSAATWEKRKFTSLPLQGFWGHNLGEWHSGPTGPWVGVQSPYSRAKKGMYQPFHTGRGGVDSPLPVFRPKHDIEPMNAYRMVAENPSFLRNQLAEFEEFIYQAAWPGFIHNPGGFHAGY